MSIAPERRPTVLVVDDKKNLLRLLAKVLRDDAEVLMAECGTEAIRLLQREPVDAILCDLRMPDMEGIDVLKECKRLRPRAEFVLMTAYASVPTAVEALRLGAYDYLIKPFEPEHARAVVLRAIGRAASTISDAPPAVSGSEILPGMIGRSATMRELAEVVHQIAPSDATVLLLGETGTGKELIARAMHRLSTRSSQRFVAVNCAAIPADLLESELFGYAKGSFTGATKDRGGLFEDANKGTLFLDEIGEMRLSLQAKLTRALEERAIRRLGESKERAVDVRLITATHRDIEAMVKNQSFREDLWYRLNVAAIRIPPLRDRREDVELLAAHFLQERAPAQGRQLIGFTSAAIEAMERFDWPGNVRQLRAAIERASIICKGERIEVGDLPPEITGGRGAGEMSLQELTWAEAQERGRTEVGRQYLEDVLRKFDGNIADAAAHAGVERESFYRLLRRYGVHTQARRARSTETDEE